MKANVCQDRKRGQKRHPKILADDPWSKSPYGKQVRVSPRKSVSQALTPSRENREDTVTGNKRGAERSQRRFRCNRAHFAAAASAAEPDSRSPPYPQKSQRKRQVTADIGSYKLYYVNYKMGPSMGELRTAIFMGFLTPQFPTYCPSALPLQNPNTAAAHVDRPRPTFVHSQKL
jgi:hypothetical protein